MLFGIPPFCNNLLPVYSLLVFLSIFFHVSLIFRCFSLFAHIPNTFIAVPFMEFSCPLIMLFSTRRSCPFLLKSYVSLFGIAFKTRIIQISERWFKSFVHPYPELFFRFFDLASRTHFYIRYGNDFSALRGYAQLSCPFSLV